MKLKAAVSDLTPKPLIRAFSRLRLVVLEHVLIKHLHTYEFGPGEFYVQRTDRCEGASHALSLKAWHKLSGRRHWLDMISDKSWAGVQKAVAKKGAPDLFCEVRLTGVSYMETRAVGDFDNAAEALKGIYRDVIERYLPKGRRMQLLVCVMTDRPLEPFRPSSLVERPAVWVEGKA